MKQKKLNQIVASEKSVKSRSHSDITALYQSCSKQELFNGFSKTYEKQYEDGEEFPPESKKVQVTVEEILESASLRWKQYWDIAATKDFANCSARADVVMPGGEVLIENAPIPFLLFMEKQIGELSSLISKLPVLDPSESWEKDDNGGLYKTSPTKAARTKKVQTPVVLYEATDKHPAQTQLVSEDVLIGYWKTVKNSGCIPELEKTKLLKRVEAILLAVKEAREEANSLLAEEIKVGDRIFNYLFA